MSPPISHPPARSRHLLEWASRRLGIPEMADDAAELFREKSDRRGERAARWWYRRQMLASIGRAAVSRARSPGSEPRGSRRFVPFVSWLDVRLAGRMLSKYPGLTAVAIFALAIGIPIGLLPLHILSSLTKPLPVEEAEKVVIVGNYDRMKSRFDLRSIHDFAQWREELTSFEALGMWRQDTYTMSVNGATSAPVRGAEVMASVFSILRVPPLMGRPLNAADEMKGAPDVAIIGYELWQSRMAGDRNVVGSTIRIGGVPHTIVGVMPAGFLFPVRDHIWLPFRHHPLDYARGAGPAGRIVGRVARGATVEQARKELELIGQRLARESPATHANLQPRIVSYTRTLTGVDNPETRVVIVLTQVLALLLLALACGNVGILILARAATRSSEIAVRTALGASRARILSQMFVESLLLAILGAGVGLGLLQAVATGPAYLISGLPFWVDYEVSLETAGLALGLAVVSAALAGVVPALKATGKDVRASMQLAAGGSGIRFGKGYSALIVAEVAAALVFLALGSALLPTLVAREPRVGIQADQYLYAGIRLPRVEPAARAELWATPEAVRRVGVAHRELIRRFAEEPGVGPVAIADALPGTSHDTRYVEIEGLPRAAGSPAPAHLVNVARVDLGFFDALDQRILSGRAFTTGDLGNDSSAVIVNTSFVERVLGGRNPIGRRIRYWSPGEQPGPWLYEIVGVVGSLGMNVLNPDEDQGLYHAAAPGTLHPLTFAVRVGSEPERFAPRLRSVVSAVEPTALMAGPVPLDKIPDPNRRVMTLVTYLVMTLAVIAVVLAAACLYALMSFTVAERRRESAIRAALGARPTAIASSIVRRALFQLSTGVVIGAALSAGMFAVLGHAEATPFRIASWPLNVAVIALFVLVVGMLACVRPTIRAVRIQPLEALKG